MDTNSKNTRKAKNTDQDKNTNRAPHEDDEDYHDHHDHGDHQEIRRRGESQDYGLNASPLVPRDSQT